MESQTGFMPKGVQLEAAKQSLRSQDYTNGNTEIEPEVFDTVLGLTLLGYKTVASCGGHPKDEGRDIPRGPYILLEKNRGEALTDFYQRLREVLDEFYARRKVSERDRIIIRDKGERPSRGYVLQNNVEGFRSNMVSELPRPVVDRVYVEENLPRLRKEFQDFSEFLLEKFENS